MSKSNSQNFLLLSTSSSMSNGSIRHRTNAKQGTKRRYSFPISPSIDKADTFVDAEETDASNISSSSDDEDAVVVPSEKENEVAFFKLDLFLQDMEDKLRHYANDEHHIPAEVRKIWANIMDIQTMGLDTEEWKGRAQMYLTVLEDRLQQVKNNSTVPAKVNAALHILSSQLEALETNTYFQSTLHTIDSIDHSIQHGADVAHEKLEKLAAAIKNGAKGLITFEELPWEWQNNEYILSGYRFYDSYIACISSIVGIHNETGNIWTHLLGFIFMLVLGFYNYPKSDTFQLSTKTDIFVFAVFVFAAVKCLACSVIWHTFANLANVKAMQRLACMDYVGISVLIAASIVTMEYHGFYCQPIPQIFYVGLTTILGILGVIIPWFPFFERHENRPFRILFFLSIAVSGALPYAHLSITQSPLKTLKFFSPIVKSLAGYVLGVCIYANKWPEKWYPGVFDLVGGSHQLWHLCILIGIYYHYVATHMFLMGCRQYACSM